MSAAAPVLAPEDALYGDALAAFHAGDRQRCADQTARLLALRPDHPSGTMLRGVGFGPDHLALAMSLCARACRLAPYDDRRDRGGGCPALGCLVRFATRSSGDGVMKFVEHVEALIARGALVEAGEAIASQRAQEGASVRVCLAQGVWLRRTSRFEAAFDQFASVAERSPDAVLRYSPFVDCAAAIGRRDDYLALLPTLANSLPPANRAVLVAESAVWLGLDGMIVALGDEAFHDARRDPKMWHAAEVYRAMIHVRHRGANAALGTYRDAMLMPGSSEDSRFWHGACALPRVLRVRLAGGVGDYFQFCCYLPLIARLGTQVLVDAPLPPLVPCMDFADLDVAVDRVRDRFVGPAPHDEMWTSPFVLWSLFYPLVGALPPDRPLFECAVDAEVTDFMAETRQAAGGRPIVALFWSSCESAGYFAYRSLRVQDIAPLLDNDSVHWVRHLRISRLVQFSFGVRR